MYSNIVHSEIKAGTVIMGKWHKKQYTIIRELGNGANGQVFLVESHGRQFALKMSDNASDLAIEYQLLQGIQTKMVNQKIGPAVFELDDWINHKDTRFFFVMEYVRGYALSRFIEEKGTKWTAVLMSQVLRNVHILHTMGYSYGDLKLDNCLVTEQSATVRMIDFGGVTLFGKGIRQYTEWVDRAWWGQGERRADVTYDAFAVSMMIIRLLMPAYSKQLESMMQNTTGDRLWQQLQNHIQQQCREKSEIRAWLPILKKAWAGNYSTLLEMREDILGFMKAQMTENTISKKRMPSKKRDWTDYWLWIMLAGSASMFLFFFFYNF